MLTTKAENTMQWELEEMWKWEVNLQWRPQLMGLAVCQQDLKPHEQGQPGRQLWQTGHQIDQVEIANAS